jgi:hypothetical protein
MVLELVFRIISCLRCMLFLVRCWYLIVCWLYSFSGVVRSFILVFSVSCLLSLGQRTNTSFQSYTYTILEKLFVAFLPDWLFSLGVSFVWNCVLVLCSLLSSDAYVLFWNWLLIYRDPIYQTIFDSYFSFVLFVLFWDW